MIQKLKETVSLGVKSSRGRKAVPDDRVIDITAVFGGTETSSA